MATGKIKSARNLAVDILTANEKERIFINHLIEKSWDVKQLSSTDRGLFLQIVYGVLRNRRHLDAIIEKYVTHGYENFYAELKNILRCAIYQMAFLRKIPDYAVLSEAVEIAKEKVSLRYARLVNGVLRNYQRKPYKLQKPGSSDLKKVAVYFSHPDWLVERFVEQFGRKNLPDFLQANNQLQPVYLRQLKKNKNAKFLQDFVQAVPGFPKYFKLKELAGFHHLPGWKEGVFCVQDPGSGMAVELLEPQPGETIIDLCAAPGGKSLVIASAIGQAGKIIAVEFAKNRLYILQKNIARAGFENVEIMHGDARKIQLPAAEAVLVDAPCSGSGVLARRADLRWQRQPGDFAGLLELQQKILANAATLVKPGGRLVYSTCSIDKTENEEIVAHFLENHHQFVLEPAGQFLDKKFVTTDGFVRTWPFQHGIDGSFSARMIRRQ